MKKQKKVLFRVVKKLWENNQLHLLKWFFFLKQDEKQELLNQLDNIDYKKINSLLFREKKECISELFEPMEVMHLEEINFCSESLYSTGLAELKKGVVAIVLLAGGLATRLGMNCPKGMVDIGISRKICLFEIYLNKIKHTCRIIEQYIDIYIMVNRNTKERVEDFFINNNYFEYPKEHIIFFEQKMYPKVSFDGKFLLEKKGTVAMAPGGNGEWITALRESGFLKKMSKDGIQWINLLSIDNPLYKIIDTEFLGACILKKVQLALQVVEKSNPYEKMGGICLKNGKPFVKEYYELSKTEQELTYNDESYFRYGVMLNYMIKFQEVVGMDTNALPVHFAKKKVQYVNNRGVVISPERENGYVMERLALDMIPMFDYVLVYEVDRNKNFAPIKNLRGEDSLETAKALMEKNGYKL